jgi:hypothetical protein
LDVGAICRLLQIEEAADRDPVLLSALASRVRRGKDVRLILSADDGHDMILAGSGCTMIDLAGRSGGCRTRLARLFRIAMLRPTLSPPASKAPIRCGSPPKL